MTGASNLSAANSSGTETILQWLNYVNRTSSTNGAAAGAITHSWMDQSPNQTVREKLWEQAVVELDKDMYTLTEESLLKAAIVDQAGK